MPGFGPVSFLPVSTITPESPAVVTIVDVNSLSIYPDGTIQRTQMVCH